MLTKTIWISITLVRSQFSIFTRATCGGPESRFRLRSVFFLSTSRIWPDRLCELRPRGVHFFMRHCDFNTVSGQNSSSVLHWKYIVMWMASILILYTLTMLTIAHVDRSRPTIKDDERFRNGLVWDLEMKLKTLLCSTCSKTISRTISYTNSPLNVSMNYVRKCDSIVNLIQDKRSTKNVLVIYNMQKYNLAAIFKNNIVI